MGKLSALAPLVGEWQTTITLLHPAEQAGQEFQARDTYRMLPGNNDLVHEVDGEMGGQPVRGIEIYSCDAEGGIVSRNFDSSGATTDFRAHLRDGRWEIIGECERFASTLFSENAIEGRWQQKLESGWVDWMTVSLKRVRSPDAS